MYNTAEDCKYPVGPGLCPNKSKYAPQIEYNTADDCKYPGLGLCPTKVNIQIEYNTVADCKYPEDYTVVASSKTVEF